MDISALQKILPIVGTFLNRSSAIPSLSNILLKKDYIEACNGIQGIKVNYNTNVECVVKGDLLIKLINSYSTIDDFSIKNGNLIIKDNNSINELATTDINDFVSIFGDTYQTSFVLTNSFIEGIKKCLSSVNENTVKEQQAGITMIWNQSGLILYSTNNIRVSKYITDIQGIEKEIKILIPKFFCEKLISLYEEGMTLFIGTNSLKAKIGDIEFITKIKDLEILDFEGKVFKVYPITGLNFNSVSKDFLKSLERALITLEYAGSEKRLKFEVKDKIRLSAKSPISIFDESINIPNPYSSKYEFEIDAFILKNSLPDIKSISFIDDTQKVVVVGIDNNFTTIIASFPKN